MATPYRVQGYIRVPAALVPRIRAALPEHIALTRAEPGCISFSVTQHPTEPTRFEVQEAFVDHDAFLAHQARAAATPWAPLTADVERHYTLPDV